MENYLSKLRTCRVRLLLIIMLNFTDWLSTVILTRHSGFFEVNPIMSVILQSPVWCFLLKCIFPSALSLYIFFLLPIGGEKILNIINAAAVSVFAFYMLINAVHIGNFCLLLMYR